MFMLEWFHLMEKICIKNMGVYNSFEKMKPQLCFFLKTFSTLFLFLYGFNAGPLQSPCLNMLE